MGKVAIVTGASRGLGRGIALTLAKEGGYSVYATARNGTALKELSAEASENELDEALSGNKLGQCAESIKMRPLEAF